MVVICHLNVRSLVATGRLAEVQSLTLINDVDILCLTETWLKSKHMNSTLLIKGYQPPVRLDRQEGRGGGVAIYLREGLACKQLPVVPSGIECVAVSIHLPRRKKLTIIAAYRPPRKNMSDFLDSLDVVVNSVSQSHLCLVGDFNAKHSDWFTDQVTDTDGLSLKQFASGHNLHQMITMPTYNATSSKPVLLDLIFTTSPTSVLSSSVLPPVADHCAVIAHLSLKKAPALKPYNVESFDYANADLPALHYSLKSVDWCSLRSSDLNDAVTCWERKFLDCCSAAIPKRSFRVNPSSKPWYNSYLRHLANCRDRLFHRSRGKDSQSRVVIAYRKMRNLFVSELRAAEQSHFSALGQRLLSRELNSQCWWKLAKKACGWSSRRSLPALSINNALVVDAQDKACAINSHFQQQCSAAAPALPFTPSDWSVTPATNTFHFEDILSSAVASKLLKLSAWKSCGPDGVTNTLLKMTAAESCGPLTVLFNRSLMEGVFPHSWKEAIVSPVPKEGKDLSQPASYRPIALLSSPSKVFEQSVKEQLYAYCVENHVLPDEQFGFMKGRSAEWQLLSVIEEWHIALDNRNCVHATFLDAAKAFDRVDHAVLLDRLANIGICGTTLKWFHSYLSGRRIRTRVMGSVSNALPVTSGVPQGSGLGPLLFIIYYKDIPAVISATSALFADDTLVYSCDCQGQRKDPCCNIGQDMSNLSRWADTSGVIFNAAKSVELCVGSKTSTNPILLDGAPIPRRSSTTHLGVLLTNNMRWADHVDSLLQRVAGPAFLCKRLVYRHHLPRKAIRQFYLAYVRPRLEYCSAVWGGAPHAVLYKLERAQLDVARALCERRLSGCALLQEVCLPTLAWRRREHRLVLFWKLFNNQGPPKLQACMPKAVSDRAACSLRAPHSMQFPVTRTVRHLSSFLCIVVPEWNRLPTSVVTCSSSATFISGLRRLFASDQFSFGL